MKKALVVFGGWDGHQPDLVSELFRKLLVEQGYEVDVKDKLEVLTDEAYVNSFDVFVPIWTMSEIPGEAVTIVQKAVEKGMGIIGCHGGMCDAFRNSVDWQFMTGGNWVAHPGNDGTEYMVEFKHSSSPLVEGMKDFKVVSEHYYMHVDPAVEVLATTRFPLAEGPHTSNGPVDMPVIWTKKWGQGKIYYTTLGHHANILEMPEVTELLIRGINWVYQEREA